MSNLVRLSVSAVVDLFRSRAAIEAEILTLRQQIIVLHPPTGILDLIASREDLEAVAEIEGLDQRSNIGGAWHAQYPSSGGMGARARQGDRDHGAYCHPNESGGRFTSADRGAWYAALSIEIAIKETVFHRTDRRKRYP